MAKYLARQGKMLAKIMHGSTKKKKFQINIAPSTVLPTPTTISRNTKAQGSSKRRMVVLNKLFMKYITEIMAMGSLGSDILGRGIEISRVKINSDFNKVNVYWLAKGTESDSHIENILKQNAGALRHELSQLRVMGEVPRIEFVKDKYYAIIAEVEECLKHADFGDDYKPTVDSCERLKSEFTLSTPLSEELKNKLLLLEKDDVDNNEDIEEPLPVMTSNVFGLDHSKIMEKVKQAVKQSNLAWDRSKSNIAFSNETVALQNPEPNLQHDLTSVIYDERKENFSEFLKMRQIERYKSMRKEKHKSQFEKEFILNQLQAKDYDDNDDIDLDEYKEDDYLDEIK